MAGSQKNELGSIYQLSEDANLRRLGWEAQTLPLGNAGSLTIKGDKLLTNSDQEVTFFITYGLQSIGSSIQNIIR